MYRPDTAKACARGASILGDDIDLDAAKALAKALREHGKDCLIVPAISVVSRPEAKAIHAARLTESSLYPTNTAGTSRLRYGSRQCRGH